jgi:hypothetical protein
MIETRRTWRVDINIYMIHEPHGVAGSLAIQDFNYQVLSSLKITSYPRSAQSILYCTSNDCRSLNLTGQGREVDLHNILPENYIG